MALCGMNAISRHSTSFFSDSRVAQDRTFKIISPPTMCALRAYRCRTASVLPQPDSPTADHLALGQLELRDRPQRPARRAPIRDLQVPRVRAAQGSIFQLGNRISVTAADEKPGPHSTMQRRGTNQFSRRATAPGSHRHPAACSPMTPCRGTEAEKRDRGFGEDRQPIRSAIEKCQRQIFAPKWTTDRQFTRQSPARFRRKRVRAR